MFSRKKGIEYSVFVADVKDGNIIHSTITGDRVLSIEAAHIFIVDKINPMIDGFFSNIKELNEELIKIKKRTGSAPVYYIQKFKTKVRR